MIKDKPVILIVDDHPENIELLEAYLVPQGYEIVKATNGEEALGKLSGNQIDLVLLDVLLPGMDGFEVTRRIRQDNTHRLLPIILVTILRETEDRVKGIEAGCDDFISTPVDKVELLARVRSLLKVKAYNDLKSNYRRELESEVTRRTEELKQALGNLQQEISERKRAEDELKEALEKLRSLSAYVDSMYMVDRDCTYLFMNEGHLKRFGLLMEEVIGKRYDQFHSEEDARHFTEAVHEVCETGNPRTKEHKSERDGRFYLRTFTPIIGRNVDGKISQAAVISKDITNIKVSEKKLKDTLDSLKRALNTIIQVMVSTVETRDPYTAGHQLRSADLACTIATEMGLSQDKIDGIRMAGSIHDIGKLSTPAEILSKPTKLSELEFSLIKEHARKGYEILKDVESPWPLAEIIGQHHERVDGSGYPRNLKGEEICIEARILAVADVVESMASHRPYRPALGINAALDEIEKNSGTLYDNTVADVCLRLFREKGFQLTVI